MSARDDLRKYVRLLADWWTPPSTTDERVERLYNAVRAEVLADAPRLCDCGSPIPADQRKAYCSDRCRWDDQDHGSDDGGES
jgi:hypothetical protein